MDRRRDGFTLVELLIVVAVISVLAAVAVPNYYESVVRAKSARTIEDLSHVNRLLVSYDMDTGGYPEDNAEDPFGPLSVLTTPVAYTQELPIDVCRVVDDPDYGRTFFYGRRDGDFAALTAESAASCGIPSYVFALAGYGPDASFSHGGAADTFPYDATNGTFSRGNIWKFGP